MHQQSNGVVTEAPTFSQSQSPHRGSSGNPPASGNIPDPALSASSHGRTFNRTEVLAMLKSEDVRYRTFYPNFSRFNDFLSPRDLAKAGFFYFNDGDKTQCAFCLGIVGEWERGDDPKEEHARHFPRCPFILNLPVGNIPSDAPGYSTGGQQTAAARTSLQNQPSAGSRSSPPDLVLRQGFDVTGLGRREITTEAVPERGRFTSGRQTDASVESQALQRIVRLSPTHHPRTVEELGITPFKPAVHIDMSNEANRVASFYDRYKWPSALSQKPDELAAAGFFYTGRSDCVVCYHCGVQLSSWGPTDVPWVEHAKRKPSCAFLALTKGTDFIIRVRKEAAEENFEKFSKTQAFAALRNKGIPRNIIRAVVTKLYFDRREEWTLSDFSDELKKMGCDISIQDIDEASDTAGAPAMASATRGNSSSSCFRKVEQTFDTPPEIGAEAGGRKPESDGANSPDVVVCKVCLDTEVQVVLLPCRHLCACSKCALVVECCPICRGRIEAFLRIYIS